MIKQDRGTWFIATASGTAVAIATKSIATNVIYFITDINTSTSASAGTWTLVGGSTTYWQGIGAVSENLSTPITIPPTTGTITLTMNGTTTTLANFSGFSINAS